MEDSFLPGQYPEQLFAGFWLRFFAYIADLIVIASLVRFLSVPLILLGYGRTVFSLGPLEIGLFTFVFPIYFVVFTKLSKGRTLGKMIFGLRVVCFNEIELSWTTVLIRELFGRYFQHTLMFLYVIAAFTPRKQHLADLLTDTSVVSEAHILTWSMATHAAVSSQHSEEQRFNKQQLETSM